MMIFIHVDLGLRVEYWPDSVNVKVGCLTLFTESHKHKLTNV